MLRFWAPLPVYWRLRRCWPAICLHAARRRSIRWTLFARSSRLLFCWPRQERAFRLQPAGQRYSSFALERRFPCERPFGTDVTQFIFRNGSLCSQYYGGFVRQSEPHRKWLSQRGNSTQMMQQIHILVVRFSPRQILEGRPTSADLFVPVPRLTRTGLSTHPAHCHHRGLVGVNGPAQRR
jgi:hypothetical protein